LGHNATFTGTSGPQWLATVSCEFSKVKGQIRKRITKINQYVFHHDTSTTFSSCGWEGLKFVLKAMPDFASQESAGTIQFQM